MNQAIIKGSLGAIAKESGKRLAESFLLVDAIIIVDVSSSMNECDANNGLSRYEAACQELGKLQESMPGKIGIVSFSSTPQFIPNGKPALTGGMTNMEAALKFVQPADSCQIKFVLISDGEPDNPQATLQVAAKFTEKINTVYVGPENGIGRKFLQEMSALTGGIATRTSTKDLNLLAENVTRLLTA